MEYKSTRDSSKRVSAAQAIAQGISDEGGLFVPEKLPQYSLENIKAMLGFSYQQRAEKILGGFLTGFSGEEISESVNAAYNKKSFPHKEIAPTVKVKDGLYCLELWHGPTHAFKDMALQILPHLLTKSVDKVAKGKEIVILVATSGDTGKAALEGFKDVEGTNIIVFYPDGGVSPVQYLQMATQEGENVGVYAVVGNFDDTQTKVKEIFTSENMKELLEENGYMFSSANSINWGRLLPQIVYYFSSYLDMVNAQEIEFGQKINVCVPTGNFGNILAAYYAKNMGLPISKLICASNENNVLTDFINTGVYDRRRSFVLTSSPSMDILISSNLERLLYALYESDKVVGELMSDLTEKGIYKVSDEVLAKLQDSFYGGYCDQKETAKTINDIFENANYLCDTHTAVAINVWEKYKAKTGDNTKTLVASTANPYKFADSMLEALDPEYNKNLEGIEQVERLHQLTGLEIPKQIEALPVKAKRFTGIIDKEKMEESVKRVLKLE